MKKISVLVAILLAAVAEKGSLQAQNTETVQNIVGYQTTELTYNGTKYLRQQTYYDGLGRPIKKFTTLDSSAAKPDLIQLIAYDAMGRDDSVSYLPYAGTGTYNMQQCFADQIKFYNNSQYGEDGKYAYGSKEYDDSPLNIVTGVSSPGEYHNASSAKGHPIRMQTRLNQTEDGIKQYAIRNDSMICCIGWYAPEQLVVEEQSVDQSPGNTLCTRTYKNTKGQIVATAIQANDEEPRNTYCIYDEYYDDRLRCVVPPAVDKQIQPDDEAFVWHDYRDQIRFLEYDAWGNMICEHYPGREPVFYVYDLLHRVILTQDGKLRQSGHWIYSRYDDWGHVFQTKRLTTSVKENVLWTAFKNVEAKSVDTFIGSYFHDPLLLAEYRYFGYDEYKSGWEGSVYKNIYSLFTTPSYLAAKTVDNVFSRYSYVEQTGQKRYEKIAVIPDVETDSTAYVERAFYYDSEGRVVQTVEKNPLGDITHVSCKYDFMGNVLTRHELVQVSAEVEADVKITTCTYDNFGRLLTEKTTLNDSPEATMTYVYDQLGHCIKTVAGGDALTTSFKYDISGNLTYMVNDAFQLYLYRERPSAPTVAPNYAGMVSECRWMHQKGVSENWHSYQYAYTPYGEFREVQLQHGPAMQTRNVEKNLTYDMNGNILTLQRTGVDGALIADYAYHYDGNRLDSLTAADAPVRTFSYDVNGNIVFDSKTAWKYRYNILNLPESVSDSLGSERVRYTWLFDGTKVRTRTTEGEGYTYLGSLIYGTTAAGTTLESTDFANGRIVRTGTEYTVEYHVRDHLGSIRTIVDASGDAVECNDYYPFGERWDKPAAPRTDNRYLFNGKESQEFAGLHVLDFGARMYDSDIGRWWVHDPKASDYYPTSPYAYCANDPVNFVDPDGRDYYKSVGGAVIWKDHNEEQITINDEVFKNIGKSYSVQIDDNSFVNYYQNVAVSITSQAVDAAQTVLGNTALAGALLSKDSPLAAGAQQGLMSDLIHQAQSDFIGHPITQTALNAMAFVATGGFEGMISAGNWIRNGISVTKNSQSLWPAASSGQATINGIQYTNHALQRMQPVGTIIQGGNLGSRGIPPTVIENAIKHGVISSGNTPGTVVRTFDNVRVVTNLQGTHVITVMKIGH